MLFKIVLISVDIKVYILKNVLKKFAHFSMDGEQKFVRLFKER